MPNRYQEQTAVPLKIQGEIPHWISGSLIRNGPINVRLEKQRLAHWFDGPAMLHAFAIDAGKVQYSNRFLRSYAYQKVFKEGTYNYAGFAADPCHSLFKKFLSFFFPKDETKIIQNANVNVAKLAESYVALTEVPLPVRFDPQTLETIGVLDFDDDLPKEDCFESAHPHHNALKGETINYIVKYGMRSSYVVYRLLDPLSKREIISEIPIDKPAYMHSFGLTDNYIILTEYPFVVNPLSLLLRGKGFINNFKWEPERGTRFTIIDKKSGKIVGNGVTDPFFAFHHANAYEEDNEIAIDIVTYPDASIIKELSDFGDPEHKDPANLGIKLQRFTFSLLSQKISAEVLFDGPLEFPRFHDRQYDGKKYQYLYAMDPRKAEDVRDRRALYKIDTQNKTVLLWSEEGCIPGEPVFIASPKNAQEDDGVVLSVIHNIKKECSFLLVLDAHSFREMGRAEAGSYIASGLHGQFFKGG